MTHWEASCLINRLLGGRSDQPFCSRVYEAHHCISRSVFLFWMDIVFKEYQHCKNMHNSYKEMRSD